MKQKPKDTFQQAKNTQQNRDHKKKEHDTEAARQNSGTTLSGADAEQGHAEGEQDAGLSS